MWNSMWSIVALALSCAACLPERPPAWPGPVGDPNARSAKDLFDMSYAVVIGVGKYASEQMQELPTAAADARSVKERLDKEGFDTTLLLDGDATKESMVERITSVLERAGKKDRVLIYFAGHADTFGEKLGYLLPYDATQTVSGVSMVEINSWLRNAEANQVMLIVDACFSGLAVVPSRSPTNARASEYVVSLAEERSRTWLVAGTKKQRAYQSRSGGIFTRFVLQALDGAADTQPKDGWVTGTELSAYVQPRVTEYVRTTLNVAQMPQSLQEGDGDYVFQLPGATATAPGHGAISEPSGEARRGNRALDVVSAAVRGALPGLAVGALSIVPYAVAEAKTNSLRTDCRDQLSTDCDFEERRRSVRTWDTIHEASLISGAVLAGLGVGACAGFELCLWPAAWWFGTQESANPASVRLSISPVGVALHAAY
jgi:uncharacterized caspase-like protein